MSVDGASVKRSVSSWNFLLGWRWEGRHIGGISCTDSHGAIAPTPIVSESCNSKLSTRNFSKVWPMLKLAKIERNVFKCSKKLRTDQIPAIAKMDAEESLERVAETNEHACGFSPFARANRHFVGRSNFDRSVLVHSFHRIWQWFIREKFYQRMPESGQKVLGAESGNLEH